MVELAVKRKKKKIKAFFKLQACIGGWLYWVWVGGGWMREGKTERQRIEMKREERRERDFLYYFYCVIYIILICSMKK